MRIWQDPESSDKDYKADTEEEAEEDDTSDSDYEGEACVSQKRKAGKGAGSKKRRKGDPPMPPLPQEHFFVRVSALPAIRLCWPHGGKPRSCDCPA